MKLLGTLLIKCILFCK